MTTSTPTQYPTTEQYTAPTYESPSFAAPQATPVPGEHARGFAIAAFVIGIASVVAGWTFIAPIVGLVLGIIAIRRNTPERTFALWGIWLNAAMLILTAIAATLGLGIATVLGISGLFA